MSHPQVIVFSADDVDNVPQLAHDQTFTGTNTFTQQIVSTLATGTSPLAVTSTTKVTNMNVDQVDGADLDTDGTLAANSDTKIPSQKAVKTYVTASIPSVPVSSVFSRTGAVTAQSGDYTASQVGLGNVSNDAQLKIASNLSDLANASTARTNLGVAIGTDVQAYDADLTTIAGLTATTDNFIVSVASAWASRTPTQVKSTLGLVIGTNVQAWDPDLDTWAGKTAPSGTVVGTSDTQTLSNKTIENLIYDVVSKTADYTAAAEAVILVTPSGFTDVTITIPSAAAVTGKSYYIKRQTTGGGNVIIASSSGNIDGAASKSLTANYSGVLVCSDGTNWFILSQMGTVA